MILITIITLGVIGAISAILLYATSKKFEVYEDPRIAKVQEVLPGANCGGCGFAGCSNFAGACVKAGSLDGLRCPVGGNAVMEKVAQIIGSEVSDSEPMVAVIRCNGTCQARPKSNIYDGSKSCAIASSLYGGETGCSFGCLGFGDCVKACAFDAIHINKETGIAEVDEEKCTSCGACVKTPQKRSEIQTDICRLCQQRQRSRCTESLQQCMYRLWKMRKRVSGGSHYHRKQCGLHRLPEMQVMP